jgi:hypothetical protein
MKKILLGLSVFLMTLVSAQNYPGYYPNGTNDEVYFPDNYYYEYPSDYYSNALYKDYYNDYRRSINDIDWNRFITMHHLSNWQIQQIMMLNDSFSSYSAFNSYYRYNPDRWYYDRFYALQRILGTNAFVVFQNNFYNGYSPVVYYQNYNRRHYARNIYVVPRYRNVNINVYKVNKVQYHQSNPRQNIGFKPTPRTGQTVNSSVARDTGFRNDGVKTQTTIKNNSTRTKNIGQKDNVIRNQSASTRNSMIRTSQSKAPVNNGGFSNNTGSRNQSVRNTAPARKVESNSGARSIQKMESRTPSSSSRNSSQRITTR